MKLSEAEDFKQRIQAALKIAWEYGNIEGSHHRKWSIDQMVRVLAGSQYQEFLLDYSEGEDGPDTYKWDEGIAP